MPSLEQIKDRVVEETVSQSFVSSLPCKWEAEHIRDHARKAGSDAQSTRQQAEADLVDAVRQDDVKTIEKLDKLFKEMHSYDLLSKRLNLV